MKIQSKSLLIRLQPGKTTGVVWSNHDWLSFLFFLPLIGNDAVGIKKKKNSTAITASSSD